MPLRVELKPFERIIIGESVIINSGTRTSFLIDGEVPILREKDTVSAETADTPAKRLRPGGRCLRRALNLRRLGPSVVNQHQTQRYRGRACRKNPPHILRHDVPPETFGRALG